MGTHRQDLTQSEAHRVPQIPCPEFPVTFCAAPPHSNRTTCNSEAEISGEDDLPGHSNYLIGSDPGQWLNLRTRVL